jgi:hypothetical protein
MLTADTKSRHALNRHYQAGGALPHYVQGGTGFFGSLLSGLKRVAMPVLKSVAKAALPMAQQAVSTALTTKGPLKQKLKAAAQGATTKQNLLKLGRAGLRPVL